MTDTVVTLVTRDATVDNLSADDYRDIFTELRQNLSLDKLIGVLHSEYSKATWSKYERGELELNRTMRCELRRGVGLAELPATVADAVTARTHPDAAVWAVGDGDANHVILVAKRDDVALHVNGGVTCIAEIPCNRGYTDRGKRKSVIRPWVSKTQLERFQGLQDGLSWRDVIDAGLAALGQ